MADSAAKAKRPQAAATLYAGLARSQSAARLAITSFRVVWPLVACVVLAALALVSIIGSADEFQKEQFAHLIGLRDRRPSWPLVTGDGFRAWAEHVCDEAGCTIEAQPHKVQAGHVVFVKVDLLHRYLTQTAPRVLAPHVLIAHNGDLGLTQEHVTALDQHAPSVVRLFVQNIDVESPFQHPRISALPIGVENRPWQQGRVWQMYAALQTWSVLQGHAAAAERLQQLASSDGNLPKPLVYASFNVGTNPVQRAQAALAVWQQPWATATVRDAGGAVAAIQQGAATAAADSGSEAAGSPLQSSGTVRLRQTQATGSSLRGVGRGLRHVTEVLPPVVLSYADHLQAEYLAQLTVHPFVLSPPGNGQQAHRTWEALYAGACPLVLRSGTDMDRLYTGLPVVLVSDWADVRLHSLLAALRRIAVMVDNSELRVSDPAACEHMQPFEPAGVDLLALPPAGEGAAEGQSDKPSQSSLQPLELGPPVVRSAASVDAIVANSYLSLDRLYAGAWLSLLDAARQEARRAEAQSSFHAWSAQLTQR